MLPRNLLVLTLPNKIVVFVDRYIYVPLDNETKFLPRRRTQSNRRVMDVGEGMQLFFLYFSLYSFLNSNLKLREQTSGRRTWMVEEGGVKEKWKPRGHVKNLIKVRRPAELNLRVCFRRLN